MFNSSVRKLKREMKNSKKDLSTDTLMAEIEIFRAKRAIKKASKTLASI